MIIKIKALLAHQGFMRYASNTSWIFSENILRMIAGLLVGIWVARYLGPEQFGIFSYVLAFTSIFAGMAKLGIDSLVVRDLVSEPTSRDLLLGTAFWLRVSAAFLSLFIVIIVTMFIPNEKMTNIYIYIISVGIVFQSSEVITFYFQAKVLSKFVSICKMIQLLFSSVLKIYLIIIGANLFWFVLVSLFDQITLATTLYFTYRSQKLGGFYKLFDIRLATRLVSEGWPLMIAFLSYILYTRIDQIMIKQMLDDRSVGLYSAAYRIYEIPLFIALTVAASIYPLLVKYYKENMDKLDRIYLKLSSAMTFIAYMLVLFFLFTSYFIINIAYGQKYIEAVPILMVLSLGLIPMFNAFLRSSYITISGNQKIILSTAIASAVINILLNLILIRKLGVLGAVIATIITQFLSLLVLNIFFSGTKKLFFLQLKALFLAGVLVKKDQ